MQASTCAKALQMQHPKPYPIAETQDTGYRITASQPILLHACATQGQTCRAAISSAALNLGARCAQSTSQFWHQASNEGIRGGELEINREQHSSCHIRSQSHPSPLHKVTPSQIRWRPRQVNTNAVKSHQSIMSPPTTVPKLPRRGAFSSCSNPPSIHSDWVARGFLSEAAKASCECGWPETAAMAANRSRGGSSTRLAWKGR